MAWRLAAAPGGAWRVGEVAVVGGEAVEVFLPLAFEDVVACLGQGAGGVGVVFVAGFGDDGQLAEGAGAVGAVAEGLLAVVFAAEAHQVPLGGGAAQFGAPVVERDDVVDFTVVGVDGASGVAAGSVA